MKKLPLLLLLFISISVFSLLSCSNNDEEIFRIVNALIGPEGGKITSSEGRLTLTFPPGALTEETDISIRRLREDEFPANDDLEGSEIISAYEFLPDGLEFDVPVTVSVVLDEEPVLDDGSLQVSLGFALILTSSDGIAEVLENLEVFVDAEANMLTLSSELSGFTLIEITKTFCFRQGHMAV